MKAVGAVVAIIWGCMEVTITVLAVAFLIWALSACAPARELGKGLVNTADKLVHPKEW